MEELPYSQVPDVEPDSEPDPHWLELRPTDWKLPVAYLPPAMAGEHPRWSKAAAWTLIAVFLVATTFGVCLTYGVGA
jgi:hypothetical protein